MSDAADYDLERREHRALYPFGVDVLFADKVRDENRRILAGYEWTTKDGQKIKFCDMELPHLLNVVRLQERRGHKFAPQLRDYYEYRVTLTSGQPRPRNASV